MKTALYVRISKKDEASHSLASQETRLRQYAAAMEWEGELEVFSDDGISGRDKVRPAFDQMLEQVKAGTIKRIAVVALSRLSRSVRGTLDTVEMLNKADCALISLGDSLDTTTPTGRMVLVMLAGINAFEADIIGQRTKDALVEARRKGKQLGRARLGRNGNGSPNERETELITEIVALAKAGGTYLSIATDLAARGFMTPRKVKKNVEPGPIQSETVRRILNGLPASVRALLPTPKRGRPRNSVPTR